MCTENLGLTLTMEINWLYDYLYHSENTFHMYCVQKYLAFSRSVRKGYKSSNLHDALNASNSLASHRFLNGRNNTFYVYNCIRCHVWSRSKEIHSLDHQGTLYTNRFFLIIVDGAEVTSTPYAFSELLINFYNQKTHISECVNLVEF